jgi:phosphoglycolate phosphatase
MPGRWRSTAGSTWRSARATTVASALDDPEQFVRLTMGQSKMSAFTELFGGDTDLADQANGVFEVALDPAVGREEIEPLPGAESAIRTLRRAGIQVCLTTGFSRSTCGRVLDGLGRRPRGSHLATGRP